MDARKYRAAIGSIIALATVATIALTAWSGSLAAQTASMEIMPFSEFVDSLTVAPADAYVGQPAVAVKSSSDFEAMRRHLVKMYSGVTVIHSLQRGNQVFDCVPINDQPGVRLRKLKTLAEPPPSPPTSFWHESGSASIRETDTAGGPDAERCEHGTIPMRRLTLEELTGFKTLRDYFAKGPQDAGRVYRGRRSILPSIDGHSYARARQYVDNYGGWSQLGLWRPYVDTNLGQVMSLSQQWYAGGSGAQLQTVEVGWQVLPEKYHHTDSVLFIYWTPDGYANGGTSSCYNLECTAFVQINHNWYLGSGFTNYSTVGGPQYEVSLGYFLYQGNWWLAAGNDWVGYYPGSVFAGGQLTRNAEIIQYGGETSGLRYWPPMGSGEYAWTGWTRAAYHRRIGYRDSNATLYDPTLTDLLQSPCYTITTPTWGGDEWLTYFFFGGPGGDSC